MRPPVHPPSLLLAASLILTAAAQDGSDRITFSKPTDKVNKVEDQRPRVEGSRRDVDFSGPGLGGDSAAMPAMSSPSLSRSQLDALKKLQADRDWALQDLKPADETGSTSPENSGRLGIDDLFDKPRDGNAPARPQRREDNADPDRGASGSRPYNDPGAQRPIDAANDFSPRARSILDGETLFDKRRKNQRPGMIGEPAQDNFSAVGTSARTSAERRSEQRMLDYRRMLNTSVFDASKPATDGTPGLTGMDTPGLNSQLNAAGTGRPGRTGSLADERPGAAREDVFLGGASAPAIGPRSTTLPELGREAGDLYNTRRKDWEPEVNGRPSVKIPTFEMPKRNF